MGALITILLAAASYIVYAATAAGHWLLLGIGNTVRVAGTAMIDTLLSPLWLWIVGAAFALFIFYWESFLFFRADKRAEERFFRGEEPRLTISSKLRYCLTSPDCLIRLAVSAATSLILPLPFGFIPFENQAVLPLSPVAIRIISPFAVLILGVASYISAFGYWIGRKKKKDARPRRDVLKIILYSIAYVLTGLIIPAVAIALASAANILAAFWYIPALLIAAAAGFVFFRAVREKKERTVLLSFAGVSEDEAKNCARLKSVLSGKAGESFSFTAGGKKYAARIVGCPRKAASFFFADDGNYTRAVTVSIGKLRLFHWMTEYEYSIPGEGEKIVVLSPASGRYYRNTDGAIRPIGSGDRIGEYLFLDPGAFRRTTDGR